MFFDGLEAFDGDIHDNGLPELRNVDATALEIGFAAHLAGGVELRRASAIRVPSTNLGRFTCYVTLSCHNFYNGPVMLAP